MAEDIEVTVIGAGQAGLAIGYNLSQLGRQYVILEQNDAIASAWRSRWDSFTLVTPNWSLNMPDFAYAGDDPDGFLSRDETVAHLEQFAAKFDPRVRFGVRVNSLEQIPDSDRYRLDTTDGIIETDNVVVATGSFQTARIPALGKEMTPEIDQLHTSEYRSPDALADGAVLVVGTGQSGCQIAEELYESGRKVYLSVGSSGRAPRRYRGKDTTKWMVDLGMMDQTADKLPTPGARFRSNPHVSGKAGGRTLNLHKFARDGVTLLGHLSGIQGNTIFLTPDLKERLASVDKFADELEAAIDKYIEKNSIEAAPRSEAAEPKDGYESEIISELDLKSAGINSVIWATGYRSDFSWIKMDMLDNYGYPIHERGVTEFPGLYFLGLLWLYTPKSSLLGGVGEDAAFIAEVIKGRQT
jgi:putative flavoprotein involved in K+ transport